MNGKRRIVLRPSTQEHVVFPDAIPALASRELATAAQRQIARNKIEAVLTRPDVIATELQRLRESDPVQADLAAIERLGAENTRKQRNLVARLSDTDDADVAALIQDDLKRLDAQKRRLEEERAAAEAQREAW